MRRAEFFERAELMVMTALYILGHGAHFRLLRALTHISTHVEGSQVFLCVS